MKILIAEDNIVMQRVLVKHLTQWGYDVVITRNGREAWAALQTKDAPRLVILDWMMPEMDGLEVCRKIRRHIQEPYTYVILLTALHGEQELMTGLEAGADEYLTKPFNSNELRVRLRTGRRIIELQNELLAARDRLRVQATHDPLTGLWNHEEILKNLDQELAQTNRNGGCISIIMADLDNFKFVNDTHGHMAGDAVLRIVAQRMLERMRPYDALGRYGGEEFLIVLPSSNQDAAMALAERVRSIISETPVDTSEGLLPITLSLGVATCCQGQKLEAATLVRAADSALYQAKQAGRNRVTVATASRTAGC